VPGRPESSVQPQLDANVLVYAFDTNAPQHLASRSFLDAGRTGTTTLYVTSQVLCEFCSIVTNPRRVFKPRAVADAIAAITDLISFLHVLPIPARTVEGWLDLLRSRPATGGAVFDLQLAAAMLANGVQRIYTYNTSDFESFKELAVVEP
jgi:predicted nucleic acid-binding protein